MTRSSLFLALLIAVASSPSPLQALSMSGSSSGRPVVPRTKLSSPTSPAISSNTTPGYVTPQFLLPYPSEVVDYRPTINAAGTQIVFERQIQPANGAPYGPPYLYIADIGGSNLNPPMPLLNTKQSAARADWCWQTPPSSVAGPIAYSVYYDPRLYPKESLANGVYTAEAQANGKTKRLQEGKGTGWIYPTWYPGCGSLAIDASTSFGYGPLPHRNTSTTTNPGPWTTRLDIGNPNNTVTTHVTGQAQWAGFASVNQQMPNLITFAGQAYTNDGYDQDKNQIFLANTSGPNPSVSKLDPLQGRAPSWSPEGRYIAFESNRACECKLKYAIFIMDWMHFKPTKQITACFYNAQHAKWYNLPPGGKRLLIVSVLLNPDAEPCKPSPPISPRGIASLDVTSYFNSP